MKSHGLDLKWGIRPDGKFKPIHHWGHFDYGWDSADKCCPDRCRLGLETPLFVQPLGCEHPKLTSSTSTWWLGYSGGQSPTVHPTQEDRGLGLWKPFTSSAAFCARSSQGDPKEAQGSDTWPQGQHPSIRLKAGTFKRGSGLPRIPT